VNEETIQEPATSSSPVQTRSFRLGAVIVVAVAAGLIVWLVLRDNGSSSSGSFNATAVSPGQIKNLAASVDHPVFWAGPKKGYTYELTRSPNGSIFVRYLPHGVNVGSNKPYLTIATYPFPGAFPALEAVARKRGITRLTVPRGGIGEVAKKDPQSVHVAYPGVDYQIEVYDPTPGTATALVATGQLAAFGSLKSNAGTQKPTAASPAGLKSLAGKLGHPVYWIGPKKGYTYEVTQASGGRVFLRYLPPGVRVAAKAPYLTVATYPYPNAYRALRALAKGPHTQTLKIAGGGLAVLDTQHATSIHIAYPGSNVQLELFDRLPAAARQIVTSGQVRPIG
jgi:hypothetical protein